LLIVFPASSATGAPTAEVLHWWTAGGEARALKVIADRFTAGWAQGP
jgi:glucose/mannose transport system substrate-binding protein